MKKILFLMVVLGLLIGCAERKVTTKQEEPVQPQEVKKEEAVQPAPAPEPVTPVQPEKVETVAKPVEVKAEEAKDVLQDIHFDFDLYDIKAQDKPVLKKIADWLIANSGVTILIEGHCDDRGTNEYNLGLGQRRADAAKSNLMSLGVPKARLKTVSYGEEKPLCPEKTEPCWAKNRRAHFAIVTK
ncbi:MAG: peptidoglycan-associated lipoprotein Pal [bacterium]